MDDMGDMGGMGDMDALGHKTLCNTRGVSCMLANGALLFLSSAER
jgi:hypothetical protein